jgi:hypothetical protein
MPFSGRGGLNSGGKRHEVHPYENDGRQYGFSAIHTVGCETPLDNRRIGDKLSPPLAVTARGRTTLAFPGSQLTIQINSAFSQIQDSNRVSMPCI